MPVGTVSFYVKGGTFIKSFKKYLDNSCKKAHLKDTSISIVSDSEVLFSCRHKHSDFHKPFMLASLSKSFTALGILILIEENKLSLDDYVSTFIRTTVFPTHLSSQITILELLHHRSGLSEELNINDLSNLKELKPNHFRYANINYNLLGLIIETVSKKSFEDFIIEEICEPFGMLETSVYNPVTDKKPKGYKNYFGLSIKRKENPYNSPWIKGPSGYIISTEHDMNIYLQTILSNMDKPAFKTIFGTTTVATGSPIASDIGVGRTEYGLGYMIKEFKGETIYYHTGKLSNFTTAMVIMPEKNIAFSFLTNTGDFLVSTMMVEEIIENILSVILEEKTKPISSYEYPVKHLVINLGYLLTSFLILLPSLLMLTETDILLWQFIVWAAVLYILGDIIRVFLKEMPLRFKDLLNFLPDFSLISIISFTISICIFIYKGAKYLF